MHGVDGADRDAGREELMARELYQDLHPEVDCPECGGAGFFGNGPNVDPCGCCMGTGVLIDDTVLLPPRKPARRAMRINDTSDSKILGGQR